MGRNEDVWGRDGKEGRNLEVVTKLLKAAELSGSEGSVYSVCRGCCGITAGATASG